LEEKNRKTIKNVSYLRLVSWETLFVSLVFVLGIFAGIKVLKILKQQNIVIPTISIWQFIFYFVLVSLFILFVSFLPKIKKIKKTIYQLLFIFGAIYGGLITLSAFLPEIASLLIIFSLSVWWFKNPNVLSHNLLMILGLSGIGAILGLSFSPKVVIILLVILSVYDVVSVYKTKHMVRMAKSMIGSGVIAALIIPQRFSDFTMSLSRIKPGEQIFFLGGGDVIFPLVLAVSVLSQGFLKTIIISLFALIGFFVSSFLFALQKQRKPMPALPPIALFSIIGYLIIKFFPQLF